MIVKGQEGHVISVSTAFKVHYNQKLGDPLGHLGRAQCFVVHVRCRRKESSRWLSHLLMSFLLIIMHLKCCVTDDITFLSFDNHFETKVLFLVYLGSQIINEYYDATNNGRMAD